MKVKNRKGSTLIITLFFCFILVILGTFTLSFMVNENKMSLNHLHKTQAYYIARSGAVAVEAAILDMDEEEIGGLNEKLDGKGKIELGEINIDNGTVKIQLQKDKDKLNIVSKGTVNGEADIVTKFLGIKMEEGNINLEFGVGIEYPNIIIPELPDIKNILMNRK